MIGMDTWIVFAVDGWKSESKDLAAEAESLGQEIASIQATIEGAEDEFAILEDQRNAATQRDSELSEETTTDVQLTYEIRDVVEDLGKCITDRLKVVRGLWEHGSAYVASLNAQANQECAVAQSAFAALVEEME